MSYLLLAIVCSSAIALIFKYSEISGQNRYAVTTVNYVAATVVAALFVWLDSPLPDGSLSLGAMMRELESGVTLSPEGSLVWAVVVGSGAGVIFFLAFLFYQKSVRDEGVGLAGAFAKLGILLPMTLSLVVWQELPRAGQWVGLALAVGSILVVNWPSARTGFRTVRVSLLLLFLCGGLAEFSNKVFQKYALLEYRSYFLLATFGTALLWSLAATLVVRRRVSSRDVLLGLAVGIPNLFSSWFLIQALDEIPATVVFPVFGAGTILLINAVGAAFYRERLAPREKLAVGMVIAAIVLINLT